MKSFVRNLSASAEFGLVIFICFAFAMAGGIEGVVSHFLHVPPRRFVFPDRILLGIMSYQLLALAAVLWISRLRGWSFAAFGLRISWKLTGVGVLLFGAIALALWFVAVPVGIIDAAGKPRPLTGVVTIPVVILWCAISPFSRKRWRRDILFIRCKDTGCGGLYWRALSSGRLCTVFLDSRESSSSWAWAWYSRWLTGGGESYGR